MSEDRTQSATSSRLASPPIRSFYNSLDATFFGLTGENAGVAETHSEEDFGDGVGADTVFWDAQEACGCRSRLQSGDRCASLRAPRPPRWISSSSIARR